MLLDAKDVLMYRVCDRRRKRVAFARGKTPLIHLSFLAYHLVFLVCFYG